MTFGQNIDWPLVSLPCSCVLGEEAVHHEDPRRDGPDETAFFSFPLFSLNLLAKGKEKEADQYAIAVNAHTKE